MISPGKLNLVSFLYISCFCISLLPIVIYLLMSLFIYGRGLDTVHKANMIKSIIDFNDKHANIPDNIKVLTDRSLTPTLLISMLPDRLEEDRLYRFAIESDNGELESVFFLVMHRIGGKELIAHLQMPKNEADTFIKPEVIRTLCILGASSIILLASLIIMIKFIIQKVKAPITKLEKWANSISSANLDQPLPNLVYPELYNIAGLIRAKVSSEYERIASEEQFWKFCSHELRTPISVIRVGIDLLQRYVDKGEYSTERLNPALLKLKKSSHTLSHTIETILWLNRDNCGLSAQKVDLCSLIKEIINDFKDIYLIDQCNLRIHVHPHTMNKPDLPMRIVLENMIRNAFQHSIGEEIYVIQIRNTVKIINRVMPANLDPANTGFGLGRELITRIAKRLGWEVKFITNDRYYIAIVKFE